jgi:excisionase family DNA binding protein
VSNDAYISIKEASSLLGVTRATLRNWDKSGRLRAVRNPVNRYRMYRLSDVVKLQNQSSLFPVTAPLAELATDLEHRKPLSAAEVRRLVKTLHRILRDCEGNSSLIERFDELTKILCCKTADERDPGRAAFSVREGENDRALAGRLHEAFRELVERNPALFPRRFAELRLADATIRRMVEALAPVTLSAVAGDLKGVAYEEVIRNTFEKGDNQQSFTQRSLVEFIVHMLEWTQVGTVCDPACGTGGFLLYVDRFLRANDGRPRPHLLGFDIDERLAWAAGINLHMHGVARFDVRHANGAGALGKEVEEHFGQIDAIVTTPPLRSDLTDAAALAAFELGRGRGSRRRGVLFIERCLDLLRPGGLLGIIIDDSVLNGPSNADTRRLILERSHPFAIVSLPETAFMPFASVKASVLFLQKKGGRRPPAVRERGTFFARAEVVGRKPNGAPLLRLNKATGKLEPDSDLPEILEEWRGERGLQPGQSLPASERTFWSRIPGADDASFVNDGYRLDPPYHHPSRNGAALALQRSPYPLRSLLELCAVRNEAVIPSRDLQDEELTYVGLANIEAHTGECSPAVVPGSSLKSAVKRFVAGDILFAKMRPELRKVCLVSEEIDEGFVSAECLVLVPRADEKTGEPLMLPELLSALLRSDLVYGQIIHLVIGIGRPRLNRSAVLNVRIPTPPPGEQRRLVELYRRSRRASEALMAESAKALERARRIVTESRAQLVQDLLSPANGR